MHIDLTERQKEIVKLIADGYTSREIAIKLDIAENTVMRHRSHIYMVLRREGVKDKDSLISYAQEHGLC